MQAANAKIAGELKTTVKVNTELAKKIEQGPPGVEKAKSAISNKKFKVGDQEFGFKKAAVMYNGNKITAVEVLASEQLQKDLVSIQSGMIYEV